jgi:hypothetical protein
MSDYDAYIEERAIRRRVEKKLKERNGFLIHLAAFVLTNFFLWMIWFVTGGLFPWPLFATGGWGIGLVAHGLSYYFEYGPGRDQRERMVQREIERERERLALHYGDKPKNDALFYEDDDPVYDEDRR